MSRLVGCDIFVLFAVTLLLSLVPSSHCINDTECNNTCSDACVSLSGPSQVYLVPEENITLAVMISSKFTPFFYQNVWNGVVVPPGESNKFCPPEFCVFDTDSPTLEINSFNATYSVGVYEVRLNLNTDRECLGHQFNISQAVSPTLTNETSGKIVLNFDAGPLTLEPIVNHGLPPGVVYWQKDGVNISEGDSFTKEKVFAEDRGTYTAMIQNKAGAVSLTYQVFVKFPAVISITTTPEDTNPDTISGPITVTCFAIGYPVIDSISLRQGGFEVGSKTIDSTEQPGLHFEATATHTIQATQCSDMNFECRVINGAYSRSVSKIICQRAPNVTMLTAQSTNTSVTLNWMLNPPAAVPTNHEIQYRQKGAADLILITSPGTGTNYRVDGLSPGTEYEFRVRAIDSSNSTINRFSSFLTHTTFRRPIGKPTGLVVTRNQTYIRITWTEPTNVPSYAPITKYQLYYRTSNGIRETVSFDGNMRSYTLAEDDHSKTYYLTLRAANEWGTGDTSAEVTAQLIDVDRYPLVVNVTLRIDYSNDLVVAFWDIPSSQREMVSRIEILIFRLESQGETSVLIVPVSTYNASRDIPSEQCFSNLNSSETYQFCVQPYSQEGVKLSATCEFVTTSHRGVRLEGATSCHPVVAEVAGDGPVIPTWGIAVIVVSAVGLAFLFFGGCGLYCGLKKNKKEMDQYEANNEAFEKAYNGGMNGNYPYPPPQRSMSPSRSCMSYRHNNHGHHLDWQGVTAV